MIYAVLSQRETINRMMRDFIIGDGVQGRYISFSATDSESRVGALYLSNIYNKIGKFEVLEQLSADDIAIMEGQSKEVRDLLLSIKSNGNMLFSAVEQGSGKNNSNLLGISLP